MDELVHKAAILHEALPYIRRFHGRTFVVKYGGHAMIDPALKESFARDVCLLRYVGIQVVVVHGGGPQIDQMLERMGIQAVFSGGLRVTDDATMEVVEMVLSGWRESDLVGLICKHGGRAHGPVGTRRRVHAGDADGGGQRQGQSGATVKVDLGRVGRIDHVDPSLVKNLISNGFIPVIAPIAVDRDGQPLNVNADTAAGRIAEALGRRQAHSDDRRRRREDRERRRSCRSLGAGGGERRMIEDGTIAGGMIPKVECALEAVTERRRKGAHHRRPQAPRDCCSKSSRTGRRHRNPADLRSLMA